MVRNDQVILRELETGEEEAACDLARRVFDEAVSKGLPPEGVEEFYRYAEATALVERQLDDHVVVVASAAGRLVGVVETRHWRHIAMLFVDRSHRGTGLGRRLLECALAACAGSDQPPLEVTVHSAVDAVPFYHRMGFERSGPEQVVNGLKYIPMAARLGAELPVPRLAREDHSDEEE